MRAALNVVVLLLAGCSAVGMYNGHSLAQLDAEASSCENSTCQYELAMAYFRLNANAKGWAYMNLSARDGYPQARTFLVNNGKPVPPKDPGAAW